MKHVIFESYHKEYPNFGKDAPKKISFEYDKKNAYDYESEFKLASPLIDALKNILLSEIKIIHSVEYK